jgi:cytidine deaminase
MKITCWEKITKKEQELIKKAEEVMKNAYNPMSHYFVGAAVLTKEGNIYVGTFAENSSLGGTICAERAAILNANSHGERVFKTIVVIGAHEDFIAKEPVTPCGLCRQVISDFAQIGGKDIAIMCVNTKKNKIYKTSINELLPLAFGPKDLHMDVQKYQ